MPVVLTSPRLLPRRPWRSTPLLGLGLHNLAGPPDGASVLEAVSDTLGEDLRGAA